MYIYKHLPNLVDGDIYVILNSKVVYFFQKSICLPNNISPEFSAVFYEKEIALFRFCEKACSGTGCRLSFNIFFCLRESQQLRKVKISISAISVYRFTNHKEFLSLVRKDVLTSSLYAGGYD